ncbi:MAG: Bifunctional phosphoglucose/phosphomannose isomerase [Candidatus Curtissbacteria bacterium GW2011_GWA1_40_16]|uniref:Bifunctional phosphoglucose/phosphomannose isomerase n=1 Tax=Candidatus Curtissbacteria bacterium GW2011_GWA1_40_16 TaxID=1618405 RepID=A0A0G0UJ18_9BACT|nr:MAG: Bifunctional phosphoglucose/phosphomannose isomerase [Candidatus Curtissbacteria bacterium GW2011_GWA1_40_16]
MSGSPHKFDKSNLRQAILDAPGQFSVGFDVAKDVKVDGSFERVVFFGEGGSAFPASFVRILIADKRYGLGQLPIRFMQNYTYNLTPDSFGAALNVVCSYSGNTEEAISVLGQLIEKKLPTVGVAAGGQIEEICLSKNIPFVKLPMPRPDFQPRMGSGYFVGAMLKVLSNCGLTVDFSDEILKSAEGFSSKMEEYEKQGRELAAKIVGRTPLVWANQMYKELARVWTIKFNEHAKNPAFFNFFSELNHNLMVGLTHLGERYFVIMLKDPADDPRNLRRYEITADILKIYKTESEIIEIGGLTVFEKLFNSVYLADFAAYYLAEINGEDPTPVVMVEELKKRLK